LARVPRNVSRACVQNTFLSRPTQIKGLSGIRASMTSSVQGCWSTETGLSLLSSIIDRTALWSIALWRATGSTGGQGHATRDLPNPLPPGLHAYSLEFRIASHISRSGTSRPQPATAAFSKTKIWPSVHWWCNLRPIKNSHRWTPFPARGGEASSKRRNVDRSVFLALITLELCAAPSWDKNFAVLRKPPGRYPIWMRLGFLVFGGGVVGFVVNQDLSGYRDGAPVFLFVSEVATSYGMG